MRTACRAQCISLMPCWEGGAWGCGMAGGAWACRRHHLRSERTLCRIDRTCRHLQCRTSCSGQRTAIGGAHKEGLVRLSARAVMRHASACRAAPKLWQQAGAHRATRAACSHAVAIVTVIAFASPSQGARAAVGSTLRSREQMAGLVRPAAARGHSDEALQVFASRCTHACYCSRHTHRSAGVVCGEPVAHATFLAPAGPCNVARLAVGSTLQGAHMNKESLVRLTPARAQWCPSASRSAHALAAGALTGPHVPLAVGPYGS